RGGARAGPVVSAQVHDVLPDRGRRGRHDHRHRAAARGAAARCRGRDGQVLRAGAGRVHRLHRDDRRAHAPAGGTVQPEHCAMSGAAQALAAGSRWRWWEVAILAVAIGSWFALPEQALLLNEIAILALFALSLDLILGYAGIVSLGH